MGCVFCGRGPLTKEHALPRWLADPLGGHGSVKHAYLEPPDGALPTREWSSRGLDLKVKAVCEDCNGGWMNALEGRARPSLYPMIEGGDLQLSAADCETITTWLLKTVLMLQLAEPEQRRMMRADLYRELYSAGRLSRRLQAWVARNDFKAGAASATRGLTIQRGERPPERSWAHALVLGHLTCVLVDLGVGSARPILVEEPLARALLPIWPDPVGGCFPPPTHLGREQQRLILHLLADRAR